MTHDRSIRCTSAASLMGALLGATLVAGCEGGDSTCSVPVGGAEADPAIALPDKRNPETGLCEAQFTPLPPSTCCDDDGCFDIAAPEPAFQPEWADCYIGCEGLDEVTCKATPTCRAAYVGDAFHECWGTSPGAASGEQVTCTGFDAYTCSLYDTCVAIHLPGTPVGNFARCEPETDELDPGSCVGEPTCDEAPPACPADTVPGIRNGCWTGFCIPIAQCDQPPTCEGASEPACVARGCSPIYEGQNCSCDATSCTCEDWIYERCED